MLKARLGEAFLATLTPYRRRIVRLMLTTDWTMARVADECEVSRQQVNVVWRTVVRTSER